MRDLLTKEECFRTQMNSWFSHGQVKVTQLCAEVCCSHCMVRCSQSTGCVECFRKLQLFTKDQTSGTIHRKMLARFLLSINLNEERDESNFLNEENLAKEILLNLTEAKDKEEFKLFLSIFSLGAQQARSITEFLENELKYDLTQKDSDNNEPTGIEGEESSSDTNSSANTSVEEEYFDSDEA